MSKDISSDWVRPGLDKFDYYSSTMYMLNPHADPSVVATGTIKDDRIDLSRV
jgi:hypothetical protein